MEHGSREPDGLTRRQALQRAAAVGGALVWTVPVVQSMSGTAVAAAGSVEVGGTKTGRQPDEGTGVLGSKLPSTGSSAGDVAAIGVGAVAVGAALRAVAKRRPGDPEPDAPAAPPV